METRMETYKCRHCDESPCQCSTELGRPSRGLTEVLYTRVSKDLIERLDARVREERKLRPGQVISRADIVRELLYEGLDGTEDA